MKKNNDIEALRAIAILFVLYSHIDFLLIWRTSIPLEGRLTNYLSFWGGVDLFFCISGFVITSTLLEQLKENGSNNFIKFAFPFWIKRIFRIWPAAIFWLGIMLIATIFFNASGAWGNLHRNYYDAISAIFQVANFHFLWCVNFLENKCGNLTNGIYWSLSLEEQFYVVFPFLLFFTNKKYFIPIVILLISIQLPIPRTGWESVFWPFRTDALLFGVVIGYLKFNLSLSVFEPTFLKHRAIKFLSLFVLLILLASVTPTVNQNVVPFSTGLMAIICFILVLIASYNKDYILQNSLIKKILIYIGDRSYSIYLVHMLVFKITLELFYRLHSNQAPTAIYEIWIISVAIILLLLLTEFSYRFIESPLRTFGAELSVNFKNRLNN